jgi:outer membrane lipoprotein-sorting protein
MNLRFLVANVLIWTYAAAYGADNEVEKLLSKMREAYSGTKTAKMTIKVSGPRLGKGTSTIELTYMKERKFFAKMSGGTASGGRPRQVISDGAHISFDDLSGHTQLSDFDLDFIPVPINLEAMSFWDWKRQLSTSPGSNMEESKFAIKKDVSWNGKNWLVLEETAYGQGVYVDYYIDPKTYFIYRVKVFDIDKSKLRQENIVTKLERNVKVDQKLFKVKTKDEGEVRSKVERRIKFNP